MYRLYMERKNEVEVVVWYGMVVESSSKASALKEREEQNRV